MNRREKLFLVWALTASLLVLVLIAASLRLAIPRYASTLTLGRVDDFPIGTPTLRECYRAGQAECQRVPDYAPPQVLQARFDSPPTYAEYVVLWVTHDAPDDWHAFFAASPHRGCIVVWRPDRQWFDDPCYGSKFLRDGSYLEGPSPRALDQFPIRLEQGEVKVNLQIVYGKRHQ